jgi:hypothetical protein
MKLRTEMQDGCVHANGYCVDKDAVELRQAEMLVHDAAAAHALMRAMEITELDGYQDEGMQEVHLQAIADIRKHADILMDEWGFDRREDAE